MSLRTKATRGMAWTSLSAALTAVLQILQLAVVARFLSPDAFGLMAMTLVVMAIGDAAADGGITKAIIHFREISHRQISSLYWFNLLASLAVFALFMLSADACGWIFNEPRLPPLIRAMAVTFLLAPWGQLFMTLMEKELRFSRVAKIQLGATTFGVITTITAAVFNAGVYALVAGALVGTALRTLALAMIGWQKWRPGLHFALDEIRSFIRFGAFQLGERTLNMLHRQADRLILGVLMGATGLGHYSVVAQLAQRPIQTINPIVTRVAFPVFAELQSDSSRLRKGYLEVIAALSLVQAPVYLGLLVTAERLIPILLGKGWDDTVATFQILCLLGFLRGLGNPIGSLLLAKGKADWGFYQNLAAVVLYGLAAAVGTRWGTEGVALALLMTNLCVFFPLGFFVRRWLVAMGMREYVAAFLPALLTAIAMALAVHVVGLYLDLGSPLVELAVLVVSGVVLYGGVLYLLDVPALRVFSSAFPLRRTIRSP